MTSFVHLEYSNQHPGVARVESALEAAQQIKHGFSGTRGLATLLLSAMVAAVMVVAYEVMDSMAEGHLLVLWMSLWAVAFAALAAFASTARSMAHNIKASLDTWSRNVAAKRADERMWAMAKTDSRLMADLQCAMSLGDERDNPRDDGLRFVVPAMAASTIDSKPVLSGMDVAHTYRRYSI